MDLDNCFLKKKKKKDCLYFIAFTSQQILPKVKIHFMLQSFFKTPGFY